MLVPVINHLLITNYPHDTGELKNCLLQFAILATVFAVRTKRLQSFSKFIQFQNVNKYWPKTQNLIIDYMR